MHELSHSLPHTLPMVLSAETLSHACVLILRKCGCSRPLPHTDDRIAALTHIPVARSDSAVLFVPLPPLVGWVGWVGWVSWVGSMSSIKSWFWVQMGMEVTFQVGRYRLQCQMDVPSIGRDFLCEWSIYDFF